MRRDSAEKKSLASLEATSGDARIKSWIADLESEEGLARERARRALVELGPAAVPKLVVLKRAALEPVLRALVRRPETPWLLEGANHVLSALNHEPLDRVVAPVLDTLQDGAPILGAPGAAERALEALRAMEAEERRKW
jgi:hypothetical protein